jgi:uncharacterized ferritin-like protein (DUF455 family)
MELRHWAYKILTSEYLEDKLADPGPLTDFEPGAPLLIKEPARTLDMQLRRRAKGEKLPSFQEHQDPYKRAVCLHRFAGHELLAVEMMAFALLAFPEASPTFRRGLAHTLKEEQEHVRLYIKRMQELNVQFGDLPLYRHFWSHTPHMQSPLHYVSMISLTFEMANLDFAPMYGQSFAHFGDEASALLMATILKDEIAHVRFGWQWLKKFKSSTLNEWQAWETTLATTLLTPKRATGFIVHEKPRQQAGIPQEWIECLKKSKKASINLDQTVLKTC